MKIGISSSCFYPEKIEDGFRKVGELGARTSELFINSPCEMKPPILNELKAIRDYYGIEVRSLHPCTSAFENFIFFTSYERRRLDGIDFYRNYFEAAADIGAELIVFHGGLSEAETDPDFYGECYAMLHEAARETGVWVAHENVRKHHCCDPEYMKRVADIVGDGFKMVLDIKQCRRSGFSEFDFIRLFGSKIAQVHISDVDGSMDCLAPGRGKYDFRKLFSALNEAGYDNSALIELYRRNYGEPEEIREAMDYLAATT